MARPKFSFEAADPLSGDWYLKLKVKAGGKETTWTINYRTTNQQLYQIFGEVAMEIDPLERIPPEQNPKFQRATETPSEGPDVPEDNQMSEEGSAELRAAKARMVDKTGRAWHSNLDDGEDLPFVEIGHRE